MRNRPKTIFAAVLLLAVMPACLAADKAKSDAVFPVPLVRLLVAPRDFDGKYVRVAGYLGSDMRLYLSKEHATQFDFESALFVGDATDGSISSSKCLAAWVELTAKVVQFDPGAFGLAHVKDISRPSAKNELHCWQK